LQEERRRERRMRKSGRGEEEAAAAPARPVERRETHKMLQVWTVTVAYFCFECTFASALVSSWWLLHYQISRVFGLKLIYGF
jgi:hypothetical protein